MIGQTVLVGFFHWNLLGADGGCGRSEDQPDSKKSKLLGGLDLNSPEIQKLLKAKSAHAALITEVYTQCIWSLTLYFTRTFICNVL